MFDIFKNDAKGFAARARLVKKIEDKTGIGLIESREKMITAFYKVCERHNLLDEFNEELTKQYYPKGL